MSNYDPTQGGYQPPMENTNASEDALVEVLAKALIRAEQERGVQASAAKKLEADESDEREIDLVALFWHIVGKLKWVVLAAVLGALVAGVYAFYIRVPVYSATSKLYVLSSNNSVINVSDLNLGTMLTNDYQEVFKTWEVHERVRQSLDLDYDYSYLQKHLTVTNPTSTRLLYITYQDTDPDVAKTIADLYSLAAQDFIQRNMDTQAPNQFSTALVPSTATGRSKTSYVIIGFVLGAVLALAIIVVAFLLDDRPRTPDEITRVTDLPVLAVVPKQEKTGKNNRSQSKSNHTSGGSH